jgi:hypothetical protein
MRFRAVLRWRRASLAVMRVCRTISAEAVCLAAYTGLPGLGAALIEEVWSIGHVVGRENAAV